MGSPSATVTPLAEPVKVPGGPTLLRADIQARRIADFGGGAIQMDLNPSDGRLYVLSPTQGLYRVTLPDGSTNLMAPASSITDSGYLAGLAIGPDGTIYVSANATEGANTQAVIRRGRPAGTGYAWETLARTEPYPISATPFDHVFNGLAVSPDGKYLFVNSGSRTDHGEVEDNDGQAPDTREVPLTSAIFRLPIDSQELVLPNDAAALEALGVVFARGTRNAYALAFAPNGELFATDNGPDADYPDELNWIRQGLHYGFPWRFGDKDNATRSANYDPAEDRLLSSDFTAVQTEKYASDPDFPEPPGAFTDPVANLGPAAAQYRAPDGSQQDAAAQGEKLYTFTPHRSPLGLTFATGDALPADLRPTADVLSAFVLSWGAAGGSLSDKGQDLLFVRLRREGESYVAETTQLARDFALPIDGVLIDQRLYVLEYGGSSNLWELTFGEE
jgi:glucose/arabinose dehydrogenase